MPDRARLTSRLWDAEALSRALGIRVVAHAAVESTMEEARRGPPAPVLHLADEQRAGRGRHARAWESLPGNLHVTVAWPDPGRRIPAAVLAAAQAAVARAVREAGGPPVRCKWPNDGYVEDRKWCGLLAEHDGDAGALLIGLGANLDTAPADPDLGATALRAHWTPWPGRTPAAVVVLSAVLSVIREGEAGIRRGLALWPELDLWPHGTAIRVEAGRRDLDGSYAGVGPDGRLLLVTADGVVRVAAGEARRVRRQAF